MNNKDIQEEKRKVETIVEEELEEVSLNHPKPGWVCNNCGKKFWAPPFGYKCDDCGGSIRIY